MMMMPYKHIALRSLYGSGYQPTSVRQGAKVVAFHLLKGPEAEDHALYASHTAWEKPGCVRGMDQIRGVPGSNKPLYLDHPQFEGFEVRQTVGRGKGETA
jgi:hypothetical protein